MGFIIFEKGIRFENLIMIGLIFLVEIDFMEE